jgi:hypothetical protein
LLDVEGDGLSCEGLHENLHDCLKFLFIDYNLVETETLFIPFPFS